MAVPPLRRWRGLLLLGRRFRFNRNGSTAIEFVALAIPFALLVFAILESCIAFAGQQVLANTTDDLARQLRTGELKPKDVEGAKLKQLICGNLSIIVVGNCQTNLEVDLRQFATFAEAAALRVKMTPDGDIDTTGFANNPGKSGTRNMLRVFYRWPVITDFMRKSMSNIKGGKTLQFATATWQNEPFDD